MIALSAPSERLTLMVWVPERGRSLVFCVVGDNVNVFF